MKKLYLIMFLISFLFASNEEDFLKTLNEVSEIATETKLNIDKTPSSVDVIDRDFIIKSGARTLLDLLEYIPGIEISMSASGKREIIVRGNKSVFRDKIKFLINGHEVTNNLYSNQFYYYNFPAHLIKRIEFTKTPDAVLYGDKAFLGVINIITLDDLDENQLSFYQSNKKQTTITLFEKLNENLLLDLHYEKSNPKISSVKTYLIDVENSSPKPIKVVRNTSPNAYEKEVGVGLRYKYYDFLISYRLQYFRKGNFFGVINLTPLVPDKHVDLIHQYIDFTQKKFVNDITKNKLSFGVKHYQWRGEFRVFPIDFNFSNPNSDLIAGANIKEYELYLKNVLSFHLIKHTINLIFETKYAKPYKDKYYSYVIGESKEETNLFPKNIHRQIFSVAFEDLFIANDVVSFIIGARYSHYNDFGGDFSYKLGIVNNVSKKTTFKVLLNTAFRAPSWIELYANTAAAFNGNKNLSAEKITMLEFIYLQKIFKNDKLKFTLYNGNSINYIGRYISSNGKQIYNNIGDVSIKGFEISYRKFYSKGNFNISYSYTHTKKKLDNTILNNFYYMYSRIRKRFIKGYNIYNINDKISLFTGLIYGFDTDLVREKNINLNYFTINANLNYHKDDLSLIVGINNLTNHKNYYFAQPGDIINNKYIFMPENSGLPLEGRKIYLSLIKKW